MRVGVLVVADPAIDLEVDHEAPLEGASPVVAPLVEEGPADDPLVASLGVGPALWWPLW